MRRSMGGSGQWGTGCAASYFLVIAMGLNLAACRRDSERLPPEPVAECVAYEHAVAGCYHRQIAIADEPTLIPHTVAERERIRKLCTENLERFKAGCR